MWCSIIVGFLPNSIVRVEVSKMEWFRQDNTEGFDEKTLKEMNEEMDKVFANLDEEERENKSYLDYLMEEILSQY